MILLSEGRKLIQIGLAVFIQYRRVTDTQPATQPRCRSKDRAYVYVVRVIITSYSVILLSDIVLPSFFEMWLSGRVVREPDLRST